MKKTVFVVSRTDTVPAAAGEELQRLHPGAAILSVRRAVTNVEELRTVVGNCRRLGRVYLLDGLPHVQLGEQLPAFGWIHLRPDGTARIQHWLCGRRRDGGRSYVTISPGQPATAE